MKLSPALFIIIELLILSPSLLAFFGVLGMFVGNPFLLAVVVSGSLLRLVLVTILTPFAGGFLAYHYLERNKLQKIPRRIVKIILGYSITEIGLALIYLVTAYIPPFLD